MSNFNSNPEPDMKKRLNKLYELYPNIDRSRLEEILLGESVSIKVNTKPESIYKEKVLNEFEYNGKFYWRCVDNYLWNDDCNKVGFVRKDKVYLYDEKFKKFPDDAKDLF